MLNQLKEATLAALRASGAFSALLESRWRQKRLLILGYHGISTDDEHLCLPELYITPANLRRRFEVIRDRGCDVLPLDEAVTLLKKKQLPKKSVVITIDDGFMDFYSEGFPLLKEFGFPATVYQSTFYCDTSWPVFDVMVAYLLWKGRDKRLEGQPFTGESGKLALSRPEDRAMVQVKIRQRAAAGGASAEQKEEIARRLSSELRVDYDSILEKKIMRLMTPQQMKEVSDAGIRVELHTHRHRTPRDENLFKREIRDNREYLKKYTSQEANHFCYPSGVYHQEFLPWLREMNVTTATTCEAGLATSACDPLLLPRFMDNDVVSMTTFESWLAGVKPFVRSAF